MSTVPDSLSQLKNLGLLTDDDLSACRELASANDTPVEHLVDALVDQKRLTPYQADVICKRQRGVLVIGDYVIKDKLGAGGMGVVYKAYDSRMHREVAIKMLLESGQQSDEKIERFRREAIAAARLNHANIVTAYAASEHEGYPYLVMEYIKGRDLGSIVKKGDKLPVPEAVNYILQTARGMEYAHSRHIIHRDLKPSNLLLATPDDSDVRPDQYSRVKILDMGLARLTQPGGDLISPALEGSDLSATGMLMGTVDYMAPEQAMDTKRADHRSDIYSLGCTLFYLLTKRPVFTGNNLLERISAHLKAEIPSLNEARPEIPDALDEVFQKMVAKKPRERYQSMTEVVEALAKIDRQLSGGPASSTYYPSSGGGESDEFAQPGSSYGGSRPGSGSSGSAPTIASGSGPMAQMPGSSYGSTLEGDEFAASGTLIGTDMPTSQKLIVVGLLALMAGTMGAFYYRYVTRDPEVVTKTERETIREREIVAPPPPPTYLPPFCRPVKGETEIVSVMDGGVEHRYYDLIELDTSQLPNLEWSPDDPAVAEKPHSGPAFAEKPPVFVRFRLIAGSDESNLRPFYIMEDKVWTSLFRAFARNNPNKLDPETVWTSNGLNRAPVFNVDLMEAYWCARWMKGQLPSGTEWDVAAGLYYDKDDWDHPGPYTKPDDGTPANIAVFPFDLPPTPVSMDEETDEIGPYKVRFMAGNGFEFTRSVYGSEISENDDFSDLSTFVFLRGESYESFLPEPTPLTYEIMELKNKGRVGGGWSAGRTASHDTSFRVVLPIPREPESKDQNQNN